MKFFLSYLPLLFLLSSCHSSKHLWLIRAQSTKVEATKQSFHTHHISPSPFLQRDILTHELITDRNDEMYKFHSDSVFAQSVRSICLNLPSCTKSSGGTIQAPNISLPEDEHGNTNKFFTWSTLLGMSAIITTVIDFFFILFWALSVFYSPIPVIIVSTIALLLSISAVTTGIVGLMQNKTKKDHRSGLAVSGIIIGVIFGFLSFVMLWASAVN